jgi:hypothetical protein
VARGGWRGWLNGQPGGGKLTREEEDIASWWHNEE